MAVYNSLPTTGAQIKVITGTTRNGAGSTVLSYPTGFNKNNCSILSIEIYYGDGWETYAFGRFNGAGAVPNPGRFFATLTDSGVDIYCEMNSNNYYYNKPLRVILYKFQ